MKKIVSTPELAAKMGITRSRVHQLIDGARIVPDYFVDDGKVKAHYFKVSTADYYVQVHSEQKGLPARTRRNYDKPDSAKKKDGLST